MVITLQKLSKLCLYAAVFSITIVLTSTFFPFIGGKYAFFRLMVELSLLFLVLWWAFEARHGELEEKLRRVFANPLFIAVSLFVLAYLLAVLFSTNPYGSFWSNYERGEGGFQMLHYYAFFALMLLLFERERDWHFIFKCSIVAALLVIGYGVAAADFWPNFIGPYGGLEGISPNASVFERLFLANDSSRFQGSIGNPAYVAPYLTFALFYALYLLFKVGRWPEKKTPTIYYACTAFIFMIFFFLTQTRGGFIGLGVGAISFFIFLMLAERRFLKFGLMTLGTLFIVYGSLVMFRDTSLVRKLPVGRLLNMDIGASSAQTRFWTWGSAWQGFLERPLFGWGPENFSAVFDKYFDIRHFNPKASTETWFDRAHSIIFDYLSETGIFGLATFLGIFGTFFWQLWRILRRDRAAEHAHHLRYHVTHGLLVAVLVAYLVQGLILFDVLPIYLNLFLVLAFGAFLTGEEISSKI